MEETYHSEIPVPWLREGPFTRHLLHSNAPNGKSHFHVYDPWHLLHLGVGKSWVASGVMLLQALVPESNIDKRLAVIIDAYKAFCKKWKIDPIMRRMDIHTFGGGGSNEATASWNKAAMTSNWMRFLEDYCNEKVDLDSVSQKIRVFVSCLH